MTEIHLTHEPADATTGVHAAAEVDPQAYAQPVVDPQQYVDPQAYAQAQAYAQPVVDPQAYAQAYGQPVVDPQQYVDPQAYAQAYAQPVVDPQQYVDPQVAVAPVADPAPAEVAPAPAEEAVASYIPTQFTPPASNGQEKKKVVLTGGPPPGSATLRSVDLCAWFGDRLVLEDVNLLMPAGQVTALIGPSGCGKSTFIRMLNRMHELVPSASLAGEVLLDGADIYGAGVRAQEIRMRVGMVFQKPNPFPAMSIRENVLAGLKLARIKCNDKDALVEQSLIRAGLWREVKDRLHSPGGALSGGQQQRLCIARSLAVHPNVLLMDEPCSALDPTSTARIEETIGELRSEVTIVIVTHNMQQAHRVSDLCAFFLAAENQPGRVIEFDATEKIFSNPEDPRTLQYVQGRFG